MIKITIIQRAPYFVSHAMINLVTIIAILRGKKNASRDGVVRHVINRYVRKDVCMECAKAQVITYLLIDVIGEISG